MNILKTEPVRALSALLAFGAAVILLLQHAFGWDGTLTGLVGTAWSAFIGLVGSFFTREQVTPNASLDAKIHDAIVQLSEMQS